MNSFQLDKNSDHKRFVQLCTEQGACTVRRLPPHLRNALDPEIIETFFKEDASIVTMDFQFVYDNKFSITSPNPGVIIVKARPNTNELMSRLISKFKTMFPNWNNFSYSNIYLEIEEDGVYVSPLANGDIDGGKQIPYDTDNFSDVLSSYVNEIRARLLGSNVPQ